MKIYFSAPISNVREEDKKNYLRIVELLKKLGHNVLFDHLLNKDKDFLIRQSPKESLESQRLMTKRKNQADLVIIEASVPSFGIGQEISHCLQNSKQVIILYREGRPHILRDEGEDLLFFYQYNTETLSETLRDAIEKAREKVDVRFNFYISPEIGRYLDWISQKKKLPRSVFLRGLVERHMRADKEYKD
mgnify:CR=1 FL=1